MRIFSLLMAGLLASGVFVEARQLVNLDADNLHPKIQNLGTEIVGHDGDSIMIRTGGGEAWPNVTFVAVDEPWNLKGFYTVKMEVTNLSSGTAAIGLLLKTAVKDEKERPQKAQGLEMFEPGETRTLTLRLTSEPWVFKEPLELVGMRRAPGIELLDASNIDSIQVFVGGWAGSQVIKVSNIRAEGEVELVDGSNFLPFVDQYGQFRHKTWKGKVGSDEDFAKIIAAEKKDLAANPGLTNVGKYGGWKDGPKLEATGFFRVEKLDGQWWLVDPEGLLFWSNGPTCISPNFGYSGVEQRENYFADMPSTNGPFGAFYSESTWAPHGFYADKIPFEMFQFYKANLYRKYGDDWKNEFVDSVHSRLKSWGMNTVANWADSFVYLDQPTPYCANFFITGNEPLKGSKGYWGKFHDVFDPSFREAIQLELAKRQKEANDPWCMGFFVDNEMSWGSDGISLALDTLKSPAEQVAKQVFVGDLKAKYRTIEKLNMVWGTEHKSWKALLKSQEPPETQRAIADLKQFYAKIANTYFRTVRDELKKAAPNHLYLGCRFAWVTDAAAHASALYCDVVSYNKYKFSIRNVQMPEFVDKPVIIGEYHFGSTDRNHFHPGLRDAGDQKGRGEKYQAYIQSALENPQIVGVHWFQYADECISGRADGENYNVGLVDICDTPYPEMVEAIRNTSARIYDYRRNQVPVKVTP